MLKGVTLQLYVGPLLPIPAPREVMEALTEVSVTSDASKRSGFQLSFSIATKSPLHTLFLFTGGSAIDLLRVVLVVILNGTPTVVADGVVTNHQILPGRDAGHATLSLIGEDVSVLMDKMDVTGFPFPAMPAEGRVALILLKYAVLGLVPVVVPSVFVDIPIPSSRIPLQEGTDLAYVRALAEDVGYVFYIEPGPLPGMNTAYWGPRIKVGVPQRALSINMDAHTNVESLSFEFDNHLNAIPAYHYYDELTKGVVTIPIPPVTPLNPPLGLLQPLPTRRQPVGDDLSKHSLPRGLMLGLAKAAQWADAVSGKGELDVLRYGAILKARQLVGVRGAGVAYDGLHYVKSVTHRIKAGEYKQSFELTRNGLISTIPRVAA